MTFELLLEKLRDGSTMQAICVRNDFDMVECNGNEVYYDSDCEEFFEAIGVKVEDFGIGYAVISTSNGRVYELPYDSVENRHDTDLEDELILIVDHREIFDVTELYR